MSKNIINKIQLPNGDLYYLEDSEAKRKQSIVEDPIANGTSLTFIDSISQNAEGVINPSKKTIAIASLEETIAYLNIN